jgi:protein-disulfide isomerase
MRSLTRRGRVLSAAAVAVLASAALIAASATGAQGKSSAQAAPAAAAAADQNKLWHVVQLFYANQGVENKGWLSEQLVVAVAKATPGLDVKKLDTARKGKAVDSRMTTWQQLASSAGVNSTPSFFAGTKGKLGPLAVTALDVPQFRKALNTLINAK